MTTAALQVVVVSVIKKMAIIRHNSCQRTPAAGARLNLTCSSLASKITHGEECGGEKERIGLSRMGLSEGDVALVKLLSNSHGSFKL
jgi:hypothetical protein